MKINPINNYSSYPKTNFQPKNNKVNFGAIEDNRARYLMAEMGMNPESRFYTDLPEATLYAKDGKLMIRIDELEDGDAWYNSDIKASLAAHSSEIVCPELAEAYFRILWNICHPDPEPRREEINWIEARP